MEMDQLIKKINELVHKQKTIGLTKEEQAEQANLHVNLQIVRLLGRRRRPSTKRTHNSQTTGNTQ